MKLTTAEAIAELKKVDTIDMPARLCEAHYMAIEALKQDASKKAENLYLTFVLTTFNRYQRDWLTSHADIELEPEYEQTILRFLDDTLDCFLEDYTK